MTIISYIYVYGAYKMLRLFMLSGDSNILREIKPKIHLDSLRLFKINIMDTKNQIIRSKF